MTRSVVGQLSPCGVWPTHASRTSGAGTVSCDFWCLATRICNGVASGTSRACAFCSLVFPAGPMYRGSERRVKAGPSREACARRIRRTSPLKQGRSAKRAPGAFVGLLLSVVPPPPLSWPWCLPHLQPRLLLFRQASDYGKIFPSSLELQCGPCSACGRWKQSAMLTLRATASSDFAVALSVSSWLIWLT